MRKYTRPSKEDVRAWLQEQLTNKKPLPSATEIKDRLWCSEKVRRAVLS